MIYNSIFYRFKVNLATVYSASSAQLKDGDTTHRPLTINLLPLWRGQKKQGVRYGSSILLSKIQELSRGQLTSNFITDRSLNNNDVISQENFLETMSEVGKKVEVGDDMVVNLGGDHAIPMMTIPNMLHKYPNLRVIWIDAHADINSVETSPSGNFHGMPVYFLSNASGSKEGKFDLANMAYVGVRETDAGEDALLEEFSVRNYTKTEINKQGIYSVVQDLIKRLSLEDNPVHISFDIDALDPTLTPSTGTRVPHGLSVLDVVTIFREVRKTGNLVSCDIVEFNPLIGTEIEVETTLKSIIPVLETLI